MGNIHREVWPISRMSLFCKDKRAVNMISRHQPRSPHLKKFLSNVFIMLSVWEK